MPVVMYVLNYQKKRRCISDSISGFCEEKADLCLVMAKLKTVLLKNITFSIHTSECTLWTELPGTSPSLGNKTIWAHPAGKVQQIKICKIPLRSNTSGQQQPPAFHFTYISVSFMPFTEKPKSGPVVWEKLHVSFCHPGIFTIPESAIKTLHHCPTLCFLSASAEAQVSNKSPGNGLCVVSSLLPSTAVFSLQVAGYNKMM